MVNSHPFGMSALDPSKMDPKMLLELSQLIQSLPSQQLSHMQTLMHNAMAGLDVRKEMEDFEKSLPPDFQKKLIAIVSSQGGFQNSMSASQSGQTGVVTGLAPVSETQKNDSMDLHSARLTILQAVSNGHISPEEAEKLLFP